MSAIHPHELSEPARGAAAMRAGARWLRISAALWCIAAVAGQLFLAVYIVLLYGGAALRRDAAAYNQVLSKAHVEGEPVLNAVLAVHLAFAAAILASGALQLVPAVRRALPAVHRWNGRAYMVCALLMSVAGLWYSATRAQVGDASQHLGIALNGVLILVFAAIAWRHAWTRRIDAHRRWALRLFLVVSGVWFFRIALTLWIAVHRAPVGFDPETFTGPFLTFLGFAQYLVPLAMLELYFAAQRSHSGAAKFAMTGVLGLATLGTVAGTATAAMMLWLPRLL